MSALFAGTAGSCVLASMTAADIEPVLAIETGVYPFPWTRGNFIDSLAAGYVARLLRARAGDHLLGYFIAMAGVDEMHLLNITVAPSCQRMGCGRAMISELVALCRHEGAHLLWLEVRESNGPARAAYLRLGFRQMGLRTGYYPAGQGQRENAVVMSLDIDPERRGKYALD